MTDEIYVIDDMVCPNWDFDENDNPTHYITMDKYNSMMDSYNNQAVLAINMSKYAHDLADSLRPFAQFHCEPIGSCDGRTGEKMCPNCEAQKALSNYNKYKELTTQ